MWSVKSLHPTPVDTALSTSRAAVFGRLGSSFHLQVSFSNPVKKLLEEIPKGALATLGAALMAWLLVAITGAVRWARGLAWTDIGVLTMQLVLIALGLVLIGFVGWFLFLRTRRKLRTVEIQLRDLLEQKDEVRDTSEGLRFRRGKSTGGKWLLVCPQCGLAIPRHSRIRNLMCEPCDWISDVPPERVPPIIASL